jgi:predicted transcriptional regulator
MNGHNSEWENYGFVIASRYRTKIVLDLLNGPKTPKELSADTSFYISHVSSTLSDLVRKEIVECLTPSLRRGKVFALTESGRKVAKKLGK